MSLWVGVAIVKSTSFSILELGEADNVSSEIFKDFSRGYAYGYGYETLSISTSQMPYTNPTLIDITGRPYEHQFDVVKYEYYTIPFERKIKLYSSVNSTEVMIYAHE